MRGHTEDQDQLFTYVGLETYVPSNHPLRRVRALVDSMLKEMDEEFEKLYSDVGRPSIPPEQLLRSLVLQIFYSIRSERMLVEQLQYNLLFSGSPRGATATAGIYSLIETAKTNGVDPYRYLRTLIARLPTVTTTADYRSLLPYTISLD